MKSILITLSILLCIALFIQPVLSQDGKKDLVAYWDFNENRGVTAKDVSGNGHDGTLIGRTKRTKDGKYGSALTFNGVDSQVEVPYHKDLNPEVFTITAWANVVSGHAGYRAVVSSISIFPARGYIFFYTPLNTWEFWIGTGVNGWRAAIGSEVNTDEWDHLAGTYSDGNRKFYLNGELISELYFEISVNPNEEFLIGAGANERAHEYRFLGKIDEVRLYNRVLTEDEIAAVMDSESLDVEPTCKIALTWGQIKTR